MDANYFEKLTIDMLSRAPLWNQKTTIYLNSADWVFQKKTANGINVYKMIIPREPDANIFLFQIFYADDNVYEYYLSPEAEDPSTGETVFPVFYIGHNEQDVNKGYSHIQMYMNVKEIAGE